VQTQYFAFGENIGMHQPP